jgi:hypothetical protein
MANIITTIGWFGFLVSAVYFIVYDRMSGSTSSEYIFRSRDMLIGSAGLVLFGYVLKYLGGVLKLGTGKCKKCGKRINKSERFCFDHSREAIWEAQERARSQKTR